MKKQSFNILMADDDPVIPILVSNILKRMGHTVDVAVDGKIAMRMFASKPGYYDVVLTDHSMPEMTGLDLVRNLRMDGFEGKIIVMSGSLTSELTDAYRSHSVDAILQKPFTQENFSVVLGGVLEKWASREAHGCVAAR